MELYITGTNTEELFFGDLFLKEALLSFESNFVYYTCIHVYKYKKMLLCPLYIYWFNLRVNFNRELFHS